MRDPLQKLYSCTVTISFRDSTLACQHSKTPKILYVIVWVMCFSCSRNRTNTCRYDVQWFLLSISGKGICRERKGPNLIHAVQKKLRHCGLGMEDYGNCHQAADKRVRCCFWEISGKDFTFAVSWNLLSPEMEAFKGVTSCPQNSPLQSHSDTKLGCVWFCSEKNA